jgi:hypothetical protein
MTHSELCLLTAKRFNKKVALYEYKSFASYEEPDVLVFDSSNTSLYEIKISRQDFKADQKKECRIKYKPHYSLILMERHINDAIAEKIIDRNARIKRQFLKLKMEHMDIFYKEASHLGKRRYYVCLEGLILIDELPEGWGLYYVKGEKFYLQRKSEKFRSNVHTEKDLLVHALRRYASGDTTGIIINTYNFRGKRYE